MMRGLTRLMALMMCLATAGCASIPQKETPPQIQRISAAELERLLPKPDPNLTYDELIRLSREGFAPDAIIEKIKQSNSRYALTPSKAVELGKQGVDAKVLDYIHAAWEQALRDGFADEINKREQEHKMEADVLQRQQMMRSYPVYDPFRDPYLPYWRYPYSYRRWH